MARLYLIRHSKAESGHPEGDRHRVLSPKGKQRVLELLPVLREKGFSAEVFLSSPYPRARETASLFGNYFHRNEVEVSESLIPEGHVDLVMADLRSFFQTKESVAVFTHNPLVSYLADFLVRPEYRREIEFHTPTVMALEFDGTLAPAMCRLLWVQHPLDF